MDQLTSDLLTNWGLGDYVRTFCEGRIDAGTLRLLCNDEIIQLIPIPGDRARFKANLDNWKAELKSLKPTDSIFNTTANLPTLSCSELELENASFGSLLTELGPSYQPSSQCRPLSAPVQPTASSLQDQAASKPEDSPSHILQGSENRTSTPIHGISQGESLRSGYVLRTLQSSHDGKAILNQGRLSGKLDETQRNLIVKLIIGPLFEKDPYVIISNTQLLNWALEVQELFPNESAALYYTPYISTLVRGTARNASGKLLRYVYNRRRQLREKGIIEGSSRSRSSSTSSNTLKLQSPVAHLKGKDLEEEIAEKLTFLRNSLEPWHLVEEYWKATANYRLAKNYSEPGTLQEYFNEYPVLKQSAGYMLLLEDFNILYHDKSDALFISIVALNNKVFELAQKKLGNIRDRELKSTLEKYMSAVSETASNDTLNNVCLLLLPFLTSSVPLKDKKKNTWKPSKTEVRDGFITQIGSDADLETTIASRIEKLHRFGKSLQPFIVFVGTVSDISHCYVIAGSTYYYFEKLLKAVDVCFKIIHATGAKYQEEALVVWMIIQKGFFRLQTVHDKEFTTVNSLLVDLGIK